MPRCRQRTRCSAVQPSSASSPERERCWPWRKNTNYNPAAAPGNYTGDFALPEKDAHGNPLHGAGGFQIGSTMKPFVFAEWLRSGHSMATILDGSVRVYKAGFLRKNSCGTSTGSYDPALGQTPLPNDDPKHYNRMSVLQGLYQSINTITFQTAVAIFCNIQKMATAAGVKNGHTNRPDDLSSIASLIGTRTWHRWTWPTPMQPSRQAASTATRSHWNPSRMPRDTTTLFPRPTVPRPSARRWPPEWPTP